MTRSSIPAFILLASWPAYAADVAATPSVSDEVTELKAMVTDLKRQVQELKTQSNDPWLTEQRAAEIRSLVQDVLADADTRTSLADSGMTAGWDKGFFIASPDGNFKLKLGGQLQVRFVYNHQNDSPNTGSGSSTTAGDDDRWGFEVRRAKLLLSGNVVDPTWTYDIQFAADRTTGNVTLEDAGWIQKDLGDGWKIRAGQFKAQFLREEILSSQRMFEIERSLINSTFTAGTVQGVTVGWEADKVHIYGQYFDGNRTQNTAWSAYDTEYAFDGRVDWLAMGEWKNMMDYDSFKDEGAGMVIGGAVNYSVQEFGTTAPPASGNNAETDNFGVTLDATVDFGGASIAGMFVYRQLNTDATGVDLNQLGFWIRGGFFITDNWELYGQYEWGDADQTGVEDLSVLSFGATRFWNKHGLKWQTDFGYGLNEVASTWASDGAGWRTDASGEEGQIVIRSQLQLLF